MVSTIKGNMVKHLQSEEHLDVYAHQCNCFCRMGRGIAPQLAKAVVGLREVDNETPIGGRNKMGTMSYVRHANGSVVCNLYAQYHWKQYPEDKTGRNTCYVSLERCLDSLKKRMLKSNLKTLGLPLIGCGLAGGDWDGVVYPMIERVFKGSNIEVTIFKL